MKLSSTHAHSLGHLDSQAKEIIYNVRGYFIAEKVDKKTLIHIKFEVPITFGNAGYCMAKHQLERRSLYLSSKKERLWEDDR